MSRAAYPQNVKDRARELYLAGETPTKISNILTSEFGVVDGKPYKASTIKAWAQQGRWLLAKQTAQQQALVRLSDIASITTQEELEEQLALYRRIWQQTNRGVEALSQSDTPLRIRGARDMESAAKAADVAIQGARKIQEGVLSAKLLNGILRILMDEIADERVLRNVAIRFQQLQLELVSDTRA